MELPRNVTFIMIDSDIEECITQIGNILANDYHIYTDRKEIVAHAVMEMYLKLREGSDFFNCNFLFS